MCTSMATGGGDNTFRDVKFPFSQPVISVFVPFHAFAYLVFLPLSALLFITYMFFGVFVHLCLFHPQLLFTLLILFIQTFIFFFTCAFQLHMMPLHITLGFIYIYIYIYCNFHCFYCLHGLCECVTALSFICE